MELKEALDIIDATVGMFKDLRPMGEWDMDFLQTPVEVSFEDYFDENFNRCTERRAHFYHKRRKRDINVIDIIPVCKFLVNEWPSPQTRQLRKRLMKAYDQCYEAGKKSLYLFAPILYATKWWEKEDYSFSRQNRKKYDLYDALTDTLHEMYLAIKATDEESDKKQEYTVAQEERNNKKDIDWVRATHHFNPKTIKDLVNIFKDKRDKRSIIEAIYIAMSHRADLYLIPYSADKLLRDLYIENEGNRKDLFKACDESHEPQNFNAFVRNAIQTFMESNTATDADVDEIFAEDHKKKVGTKKETTNESGVKQNGPSSEKSELPDCSDAPQICFKLLNDFKKQAVGDVVKTYYNGSYARLALIEVTFYNHNLLLHPYTHTAFVKSLVYWGFVEAKDAKDLQKIISGVSDKYKRLPQERYMDWDKNHNKDKMTCIDIGIFLESSLKYTE